MSFAAVLPYARPLDAPALSDAPVTSRDLTTIFFAALALRIAVFVTVVFGLHFNVKQYTNWIDGKSYLRMARVMHREDVPELRAYDQRVFPGYPAMIAACQYLGLPLSWSALGISWLCSALAAVFGAMLFKDRRIGWGLATLTPQWVLNGSMVMSEAPALCFSLAGLLLAERCKGILGGAFAGIAGLVRPMTCFGVMAEAISLWTRRKFLQGLLFGIAAAAVVGAGLVTLKLTLGDPLRSARTYATHDMAYGGSVIEWPFASIIRVLRSGEIPWWKSAYIGAHVPLALAGCVMIGLMVWRNGWRSDPRLSLSAPWLWINTLFALCVGAQWGFLEFQRMILMALPALLFAFLPLLPDKPIFWRMMALGSWFTAVAAFQNV
jgi:hypothetical protein